LDLLEWDTKIFSVPTIGF